MKKPSDFTVTDLFCGAGGSSLGAAATGARLRMALNHWSLAIETHNTNFPDADHDCTDVSACDPRRYPSTNVLIASPECTSHSLAKGRKRKAAGQGDLFVPTTQDPADIRSRATMWDVPRFAETHRHDLVIVENVVDARMWDPYPAWLHAMHCLGYRHREVFLNSMFCHPTPQSRDRMYIVFWRKGNRAPDLEFRPPAWCTRCERDVEGVQSWKPGRTWGRYRRQYVFCCPSCAGEVTPYYYAALNAIDWQLPAERIRQRTRPLKERTLERIRFGLERYGREPLILTTRYTSGVACRARGAVGEPLPTQPGDSSHAFVAPFLLDTARTDAPEHRTRGVAADPLPTQTTQPTYALVSPGFIVCAGSRDTNARGMADPAPTFTGSDRFGVVVINGAAVMALRDYDRPEQLVRGLDDVLHTQIAAPQLALIQRSPFLVSYYGQDQASSIADPMGTLSTRDRHALIAPEPPEVEDCYFRMLQPHEIGAGMAFPETYVVHGNKRDRVKQYGNAVTPPAMRWLMERGLESLEAA